MHALAKDRLQAFVSEQCMHGGICCVAFGKTIKIGRLKGPEVLLALQSLLRITILDQMHAKKCFLAVTYLNRHLTCDEDAPRTPCSSSKLPNDLPSTCLSRSPHQVCLVEQQMSVSS
mmetsp:Transcript_8091/g.50032  ORF Transcript_8091/g.50032 Transcript_8091/m.50032 type:complete len:117 (-) Transcript_8091:3107-3457(-)